MYCRSQEPAEDSIYAILQHVSRGRLHWVVGTVAIIIIGILPEALLSRYYVNTRIEPLGPVIAATGLFLGLAFSARVRKGQGAGWAWILGAESYLAIGPDGSRARDRVRERMCQCPRLEPKFPCSCLSACTRNQEIANKWRSANTPSAITSYGSTTNWAYPAAWSWSSMLSAARTQIRCLSKNNSHCADNASSLEKRIFEPRRFGVSVTLHVNGRPRHFSARHHRIQPS